MRGYMLDIIFVIDSNHLRIIWTVLSLLSVTICFSQNTPGHKDCSTNPCVHGTCQPKANQSPAFTCQCNNGFTGPLCDENINDCNNHTCRAGRCVDGVNSYTCNCTGTGFEGRYCNLDVNECDLSPAVCGNGTCFDMPGYFDCHCPPGYTGERCGTDIDECGSNPCQHNGRCEDDVGTYHCVCSGGYTGPQCTVDIDDCVTGQCATANTECRDKLGGYDCVCKSGFTNSSGVCEDINECDSNPCINGTCLNRLDYFECDCNSGYRGRRCEEDIDECQPNPCLNSAACTNLVANYTCSCHPGYRDKNCSTNINDCFPNPCVHAHSCTDLVNAYTCDCEAGWNGTRCDEDVNECVSLPEPCYNGGTCINDSPSYNCTCATGFNGMRCNNNINDCVNNQCNNSARCIDDVNRYSCNCSYDWMGAFCDQPYNVCSFHPCINGMCELDAPPPSHNYRCNCSVGFEGFNCSVNIDDCRGVTCTDGKVCIDGINDYECKCLTGYGGVNCSLDIDECRLADMCKNKQNCTNSPGSYTCHCAYKIIDLTQFGGGVFETGFKGRNCEKAINECNYTLPICLNEGVCQENKLKGYRCLCASEPGSYVSGEHCERVRDNCEENQVTCQNGGTCLSIQNTKDFKCQCVPGWTGEFCGVNIDECQKFVDENSERPCQYNGTCRDEINGYRCECIAGITGAACETNIDDCTSETCGPGACTDLINDFECNCTDTGFKGYNCSSNIDDCESNSCHHNSSCNDGIKSYNCTCLAGYSGHLCDIDYDDCAIVPCGNHGTCYQRSHPANYPTPIPGRFSYDRADGYLCKCQPGYNGITCDNDIDECDLFSQPCQNNGVCHDNVADYTCQCATGYRGKNCSIEINECLAYHPCRNGAVCRDRVADYTCRCKDIYTDHRYTGKNCSVRLTGCDVNRCQNSAACVPVDGLQGFRCKCQPGFTGNVCETDTATSLDGRAGVMISDGVISSVSVDFKTKLSGAVLFVVGSASRFVSVEVVDAVVCLMMHKDARTRRVECSTRDVGDNDWHTVTYRQNSTHKTVIVDEGACNKTVDNCTVVAPANFLVDSPLIFGGHIVRSNGLRETMSRTNFIGCLHSITVNGVLKLPSQIANAVIGCNQTKQCHFNTCNWLGTCTDLWYNYRCDCRRPYLSPNCSTRELPATFGSTSTPSLLTYNVSSLSAFLERLVDFSLFLQTRSTDGVILYLGNSAIVGRNRSFVTLEFTGGRLCSRLKLCGRVVIFCSQRDIRYDDGQLYFARLVVTRTRLSLSVNGWTMFEEITTIRHCSLSSDAFLIGGFTVLPTQRRRRQAQSFRDILSNATSYKGVIQDMSLNGEKLRVSVNDTSDPSAITPAATQGVVEGVVTADVCAQNNPCVHGNCTNVHYNTYKCMCEDGYAGDHCDHTDWCKTNNCPSMTRCTSRTNSYECVGAATFSSSLISYTAHLQTSTVFNDITFSVRTHKPTGTILYMNDQNRYFLTLRLYGGRILVEYNFEDPGSRLFYSKVKVNDGKPHNVELTEYGDKFRLTVDNNDVFLAFNDELLSNITSILHNSGSIHVGSTRASGHSSTFFDGCLDELRIGGVLLPFHRTESTSANRFTVTDSTSLDVRRGCNSDDACGRRPCKNGATCTNGWNEYTCDCVKGYTGRDCAVNVDDCEPRSCLGQGRCVDGVNAYTCDCYPRFMGDRCQAVRDQCQDAGLPCQNGADCISETFDYLCNCTSGFVGRHCNIPVNASCSVTSCVHGLNCTNLTTTTPLAFNCTCRAGYTGHSCDTVDLCKACHEATTLNCTVNTSPTLSHTCLCTPGYEGDDCHVETNECATKPCRNNATCTDGVASYNCTCPQGWEGQNCELDINECAINSYCPRGVCNNTAGGYVCDCTGTGFKGPSCQIDINECQDSPRICLNAATCSNTNGNYHCNCSLGYEDHNCSTPTCDHSSQCHNVGTCIIRGDQWRCSCPRYYEGLRCETRGPCLDRPCNNGNCSQTFVNKTLIHTCHCHQGWRGVDCSEDIKECMEIQPCQNGGTCKELNGSYECLCTPGYIGKNCSANRNECQNVTCENGASCVDEINNYHCNCTGSGYNGKLCTVDVDECVGDSHGCRNGATCSNTLGSYECKCTADWKGMLCAEEVVQSADNSMAIAVGVVVGVVVLAILIGIGVFVMKGRQSRSKSGKYNPSRQEVSGARVELDHVIKKDPVEKLI